MTKDNEKHKRVPGFKGSIIKKRRKELGISQKDLAKGITSQAVISLIENFSSGTSIDTLVQILHRLNLSFSDIFTDFQDDAIEVNLRKAGILLFYGHGEAATAVLKSLPDYASEKYQRWITFFSVCLDRNERQINSEAFFLLNKLLQENNVDIIEPLAASMLSLTYLEAGKVSPADYYASYALEKLNAFSVENYCYEIIQVFTNIAYFYFQVGNYQKALQYSQQGIEFSKAKKIFGTVDRLFFLEAYSNVEIAGEWTDTAIESLKMCFAFASYTQNASLTKKAENELVKQGCLPKA